MARSELAQLVVKGKSPDQDEQLQNLFVVLAVLLCIQQYPVMCHASILKQMVVIRLLKVMCVCVCFCFFFSPKSVDISPRKYMLWELVLH